MASRSESPWNESSRSSDSGSGSIQLEEVRDRRSVDVPISARIQAGILLIAGSAILLMGVVLARTTLSDARSDLTQRLSVLARRIGTEVDWTGRSRRRELPREILATLEGAPRVVSARLTDPAGEVTGRYLRNPLDAETLELCDGDLEAETVGRQLLVFRAEVSSGGPTAGRVCLVAEAPTAGELFPRYGRGFLLASGSLVLLGVILAAWLGRTVTRPVSRLVKAVTRVSGSTGASGPLKVVSGDEIGRLTRAVNGLMRKIARRERDLLAAKEEAERASEVKSLFLASMSHELRTPLNGVIGITDLLAMTPLDAEQREYVNTIQASGTALLAVINDILDFSKMESGRMELHPRRFDLEDCVRKAVEVTRATGHDKPVRVEYRLDPAVPRWLVGDERRLRQVLMNLLGNGVKFTEEGEVTVRVREVGSASGRCRLEFRVHDTGIGIPSDRQEELFEPFAQVDAATASGGTGLGLAISARLVELMGGEIWVDSRPGVGSDFYFTVEMVVATEPAVGALSEKGFGPAEAPDLDSLRILVVDDNDINRKVTMSQVRALGAQAVAVRDGGAAVEEVAQAEDSYSLVFMDCRMPGMDGFEATRRIRALPGPRGEVPIVGLTAYALGRDRERCLEAGMDDHLAKPVTLEGLGTVIRRYAVKRRGTGATRAKDPAEPEATSSTEVDQEPEVLDREVWDRLERMEARSEENLRRELVALFFGSLPERREEIHRALGEGDTGRVARVAHSLKGSAGNVGAERVLDLARELENRAEAGDLETCRLLVPRLEEEISRFETALRATLDGEVELPG